MIKGKKTIDELISVFFVLIRAIRGYVVCGIGGCFFARFGLFLTIML